MQQLALQTFDAMNEATKGLAMREATRGHLDFRRAQMRLAMVEQAKAAEFVSKVNAVANRDLGGLRPEMEIPMRVQVAWAVKQKADDERAGIHDTTGYEIWKDPFFVERFKRLHPELCYKETTRVKDSSIIMPATRWQKIDAATLRQNRRPAA